MKTRIINTLLIAVFLVTAALPANAQSTEQLFQKGIMKEKGEGNLPEAIEIFNSIVEDSEAEDALQAKALLHVGLCYEKLGKSEASRAYQKLINNFPARKNEVAIAKERLSRLILAEEKAEQIPLQPKWTKIDIPTELSWSVALSPDGKELALVSDKKLWKMPLSGNLGPDIPGTPVQIDTDGLEVEWTGLSWSQDGRWIAFNEYPRQDKNGNLIRTQGIYKISSAGGSPKKIIENYRSARVINYHISLSPDGNEITFSSVDDGKQHIFTMPTDGGEPNQLTKLNAREPVYSPGGNLIAFVEDKELGSGAGDLDLYIVPSAGGNPRKIADAEKASSPVWSPDGKMIAYLDFTKGRKIFVAPVSQNNHETEEPFSIEAPEETEEFRLLAGWTPDNKIGALVVKNQEFGLYTLPAEGGQAAKILHDTYALQPRWSIDSKKIFYVTYPKDAINKFRKLYLASVPANGGTGKAVFEEPKRNVNHSPYQSGNRISPDGKTLLSAAYSKNATFDSTYNWPFTKIWKIALDGSKVEQLTDVTGGYADGSPCWSPDGEKVAFIRVKFEKGRNMYPYRDAAIYTVDASGDNLNLIVDEAGKWVHSLVWSPNGKKLAWLSQEQEAPQTKPKFLNIYDFELKEKRVAGEVESQHVNIETAWSPDSKRIAFNDQEGKVIKVMNIEDGTTEDIKTGLVDVTIHHLDWSPDGKKFVFGGIKGGEKEFWFVEDFLPLEKLAQNYTPEKEPEGLAIKQVWKDEKVDNTGTITSDGKYLSFVDWETGDLALRNLKTGTNERLTDEGTWEEPTHFAANNVISPNGNRIAYSWFNKKGTYDLKIIDVNTKNVSTLYATEKDEEIYPVCWGPEKDEVIIQKFIKQKNNKYKWDLCVFNLTDKSFKSLCEFNKPFMANVSYSPNQKYLGYDFQVSSDNGKYDIAAVSPNDGHIESLVTHPGNDRVLGWMPGENNFLFISDRSGTYDLYSVETSNGKPINEPLRLLKGIGEISPMGFSDNGTLFYNMHYRNFNTFITEYDEEEKINPENRISLLGSLLDPCWLPDGETLICLEYTMQSHDFELCLYNSKTNQINPLIKNRDINVYGPPSLSPDGKKVLVFGLDREKMENQEYSASIYSVDIDSGIATAIKKFEEYHPGIVEVCEWDKLCDNIFYVEDNKIIQRNIETGKESTVCQGDENDIFGILKRYNNTLIFDSQVGEEEKQIKSVSVHDGQIRTICKLNTSGTPLMFKKVAFPAEGNCFIVSVDGQEDGSVLYKVSLENGKPEKIWQSKNRIAGLNIYPNNDKIAISLLEQHVEIRKIENLKQEIEKIYAERE